MVLPLVLTCCLFACSDDKGKDPDPEPPVSGEIGLTITSTPDSVLVGETAEFTIKAVQDNQKASFGLTIDTIGNFDLKINNISYKNVTTLNPEAVNAVKFSPQAAGECKMVFNISGGNGKKATKEVKIKGYDIPVSIEFSSVPDSVSVKDVTEFNFTVKGREGEEYTVKIDTVVPEFKWLEVGHSVTDLPGGIRKGVDLQINGQAISENLKVTAGAANTFSFSNPQAIGEYKILLTVTDKYGKETKVEKIIKAYSPEKIVIDFLEVDAQIELGFGWEPELYYEKLNEHFDYYQLPDYFKGKSVDTIYSVEEDMPGHPGETTIPGRGMIVYIGQGEETELYIKSTAENIILSPHWDNDDNSGNLSPLQQTGLHALDFNTNPAKNFPGTVIYNLYVFDKWGKRTSKTLTIIALPYGTPMPYPDNVWRRRYDWDTHVDPVR